MHKTSFPKQLIVSSIEKNGLRHRRGNGRAPADLFCFLFLQRSPTCRISGPAQQFKHAPTQFQLNMHHQFGVVCGKTVPLQIKLTSQRLMVSTRNTSRSHTNPPRMQDQPGDVDTRPPRGTLETVQVNTEEVEALRITN